MKKIHWWAELAVFAATTIVVLFIISILLPVHHPHTLTQAASLAMIGISAGIGLIASSWFRKRVRQRNK